MELAGRVSNTRFTRATAAVSFTVTGSIDVVFLVDTFGPINIKTDSKVSKKDVTAALFN